MAKFFIVLAAALLQANALSLPKPTMGIDMASGIVGVVKNNLNDNGLSIAAGPLGAVEQGLGMAGGFVGQIPDFGSMLGDFNMLDQLTGSFSDQDASSGFGDVFSKFNPLSSFSSGKSSDFLGNLNPLSSNKANKAADSGFFGMFNPSSIIEKVQGQVGGITSKVQEQVGGITSKVQGQVDGLKGQAEGFKGQLGGFKDQLQGQAAGLKGQLGGLKEKVAEQQGTVEEQLAAVQQQMAKVQAEAQQKLAGAQEKIADAQANAKLELSSALEVVRKQAALAKQQATAIANKDGSEILEILKEKLANAQSQEAYDAINQQLQGAQSSMQKMVQIIQKESDPELINRYTVSMKQNLEKMKATLQQE